jgi:2'-5' RNA ligase
MARLFFALWPDNKTQSSFYHVARQFKNEKIRLVKKSNLHITLEFLGQVSEYDQRQLIEKSNHIQVEPFELELTSIGWWKKPGVLWIGPQHIPQSLTNLVESIKQIVEQQGLETDKRSYKPHIAIARKVKQDQLPEQSIDIRWQVNSFALIESKSTDTGVVYQIVQQWAFN